MTAGLLLLLACGVATPPDAPDREQALAAAEQLVSRAPATPAREGAPVVVEVTWEGIGKLHKGYFSTPDLVADVSDDLRGHLATSPAQVRVGWDEAANTGWVRLVVPPGALATPPGEAHGRVDLQALAPLTRALASWRDGVASRYDLRVQSFGIGVDFYRGALHCRVGVAGTPPPDGSVVSPCVQVNGAEVCGVPGGAGVAFTDPRVADCLP